MLPGQNPDDEEYSDMQMSFGFTFGDDMVPEPYIYTTVYPQLEGFPDGMFEAGVEWLSDSFTGMVWRYACLLDNSDSAAVLLSQWRILLGEGWQKYGHIST